MAINNQNGGINMSKTEISNQIAQLSYDPRNVMVFNGNKCENYPAASGKENEGSYIVVKREKRSLSQNYDVLEASGNLDKTYPGALLLANRKLVEGNPIPLLAKRSPINITINLPNVKKAVQVAETNYASVGDAIDNVLNEWKKNGGIQNGAQLQMKKSIVHDEKSLGLAFGCNVDYMKNKLNIDFNMIEKGEMSAYLVQYKQVYYSVSANMPDNPGDVFDDSVTWDMLKQKGVDSNNPPAMITTVQYGRVIYALFKSSMSSQDLAAKVDGTIAKGGVTVDINGSVKNYNKNSDITCEIVMLGGDAKTLDVDFNDENIGEKINNIIYKGLTFSDENPAYPVSYTASFLKNGETAAVKGTTEYVVTTSTMYKSGTLNLEHTGAYIARFTISWDEITGFNENGEPIYTHRDWGNNGKNLTARYTTQIPLGGNVRNINIKAEGKTGLVWEPWRVSFDRRNLPMVPVRTIKIWGTTLNQKSSCEEA